MEETIVCYNCEQEFSYDWADTFCCPFLEDGQFQYYTAVKCPSCSCENEV